ncbi:MAG: hypothetical protein GEU96_02590 [Propionibacteriales bacterium]|nr:hypothetical protein [Propionibacteriales bacterium]
MTASRLAVLAAITSLVAWGLKAVAIWVAGGLDESPLESPLFVLGLAAIVVAVVSLGVAVARERPLAFKVIGGVVGLLIGVALSSLASFVAAAVIPDSAGWVQEEAGLWLSALLALGVTAAWYTKRGTARTAV